MADHPLGRRRPVAVLFALLAALPAAFAAAPARAEPPLAIEAVYTGEVWNNVHGGLRRETVYLDNLDIVASLDAAQIGLADTTIVVSSLYNNRNTFSETTVGDLQTISNIDTDGSLRLYEAWIERDFGWLAIKGGLIDLNSEFDVNEPGSLFINSSHGIGPDFSQVGETGPSIFPLTGLGLLGRLDLMPSLRVAGGVFEGTPGNPYRPRRMLLDLNSGEGILIVGEAVHAFGDKAGIKVGAWHHTGGRVQPIDADRSDAASTGAYVHIAGQVARNRDIAIDGFVRLGFADPGIHQIASYTGAGIVLSGPLLADASGEEQIGLAVALANNGTRFRRARAASGKIVEKRETVIEFTYRRRLFENLALQPSLQYVVNPSMEPDRRNALAVGLRFEVAWRSTE